jgi:manganese/zinc/iron transport system permease protein
VPQWLRERRSRQRVREGRLLLDAHVLHGHGELTPATLARRRHLTEDVARAELGRLVSLGLAERTDDHWQLTPAGDAEAHRLEASMRVGRARETLTPASGPTVSGGGA